jgi:integral membrane protein (TIGR01906 family)
VKTLNKFASVLKRPAWGTVAYTTLVLTLPILFTVIAVRLVMSPLFLRLEYTRANFPPDPYGFTLEERLRYAPPSVEYLLNGADISFLEDLRLPRGIVPLDTCVPAPENNNLCYMFNARELQHMADVKQVTFYTYWTGIVLSVVSLIAGVYLWQQHRLGLRLGLLHGSQLALVFIVTIVVLATTAWDFFFTGFHRLFFEGDSWLFRYSDTLIRLFPEVFWFDAAISIGIIVTLQALIVLCGVWFARPKRQQPAQDHGPRFVAIGGGTGLPSALRALKTETTRITAIVTVADDGGSSGKLRDDLGVLPPGDLRNNIVALADDESIMAKLFQFRFKSGDLKGHAFGNLFISALASVTEGGLETALIETSRVLNIQGRVLPSTLADVKLRASVRMPGKSRSFTLLGESLIGESGGFIEHLEIDPIDAPAYPESVQAILNADMVVIGPGSLYTSILPNLLIKDIADALRATPANIVYICNVATQPGETEGYSVAEHVMAIDTLIGRGVFQTVLANDHYPPPPVDSHTFYVPKAPENHEILERYQISYADLTDDTRPWRHDPRKLSVALMKLYRQERRRGH